MQLQLSPLKSAQRVATYPYQNYSTPDRPRIMAISKKRENDTPDTENSVTKAHRKSMKNDREADVSEIMFSAASQCRINESNFIKRISDLVSHQ